MIMSKKNNVVTLGCRLNFWESNTINNLIEDDKKNNFVVFNTCSVTNEAVKNVKKNIRSFHRLNPEVKIAVTGCAVESDKDTFKKMREVSYIVKNKDKLSRASWQNIQKNIKKKPMSSINFKGLSKENPSNSNIRKFIKIQNGCDHSCTFCIIPSCRGKSKSESIYKINKEISTNLNKGVKEIILTGVDLTSWSTDKNLDLGHLLKNIFHKNKASFRLRLSSIDAAEIDDDLLDLIKYEPRLMPHFHFSLQSLDNLILKRMRRRHNVDQIIKLFENIRKASDNVTFGSDFICGFPTENEEMFSNTLKLVEKLNITHLHVFPYSAKEGTAAARMPQVPLYVRRERSKILRGMGKKNLQETLKKQLNKKQKVLIETKSGFGRTENNFKVQATGANKGSIIEITPSYLKEDLLVVS
ncbi:MAG: tRNA (N(6)-L-threonylcarbamoyladenosine(37)-C(2))-methylthiotransferase MtaB [Rickettsiales bacterium]|nr:tRNA (N(6)-L-threonylcarbamoyladenosine(37)-C(2))-methylthiotransferase MtaB [Rickettsiales bacterium]OUV79472.1 MAG: tRNA (N(6)-L-threonylcarbamoyladenosine(37)-C(2))-methylthiotransferase MtaB [Rickettsiales bacterium TMED131]